MRSRSTRAFGPARGWLEAVLLGALCAAGCDVVFGVTPRPDAPATGDDAPPAPTSWATISTGLSHTCGIDADQHLWCWGRGGDGQLGDGQQSSRAQPVRVVEAGTGLWRDVALGISHTCGVQTDGSVWCWGDNDQRQLGVGEPTVHPTPERVPIGAGFVQVAAGHTHSCAFDGAGVLTCWGANFEFRLGLPSDTTDYAPTRVGAEAGWSAVALHAGYSCGVRAGDAYCWGTLRGMTTPSPAVVPGLTSSITGIDVGDDHACALDGAGQVWCWGSNGNGQLGNGTMVASETPVLAGSGWDELAVATASTCARAGTALSCWGNREHGRLGTDDVGASTNLLSPTPVLTDTTWQSISFYDRHLCGRDEDSRAWCVGLDGEGQLGGGTGGARFRPIQIGTSVDDVALGPKHTCSVSGSSVRCWGQGNAGRLGVGPPHRSYQIPASIPRPDASPVWPAGLRLALGTAASCGVTTTTLYCWGDNRGELLDSTPTAAFGTAIEVTRTELTLAVAQVALSRHACAILADATAYCWGPNQVAQVTSPSSDQEPPVPVGVGVSVTGVAVGAEHTCLATTPASASATAVRCWGDDTHGQLGSSVGVVMEVDAAGGLIAGEAHTCAIGPAMELWCWGRNDHGQAGAPAAPIAAPTLLPGSWSSAAAGTDFTCAIDSAQRLSCWGGGSKGQLGVEPAVDVDHMPRLVEPGLRWSKIAAAGETACGITTTKDLYCWGSNDQGQVGDGKAWRSTPTPVGGS